MATGTSLVHLYEESVGYRYFYSLRLAYGAEYPWLPQGQLLNLVYVLVQWLLTLAGHPIDQLLPRVHAFTIWGALPHLIFAVVAYYFLCKSLNGLLFRAMIGTVFALTIYDPQVIIWWTAIPEYVVWVLPIGILTTAIIVRLLELNRTEPPISFRKVILFGVFCGACVSVKVSYLVFPLAACGVYVLQYWRPWVLLLQAIVVATVSAVTTFFIFFAAFGFNFAALRKFFTEIKIFVGSQQTTLGNTVTSWQWLHDLLPKESLDFSFFIIVIPVIALLLGLFFRPSRSLLGILPSSALSITFYAARPYYVTYVETITFAIMALVLIAVIVRKYIPATGSFWRPFVDYFGFAVIGITSVIYIGNRFPALTSQAQTSKNLSVAYDAVEKKLSQVPGRTAFFAVDNYYRIPSLVGGLCKGAAEIFNMAWSDSRFIARLFPNRSCFFFVKQPIDVARFEKAVFISFNPNESEEIATNRVEKFFSINLKGFDCGETVPYFGGRYHICVKHADKSNR